MYSMLSRIFELDHIKDNKQKSRKKIKDKHKYLICLSILIKFVFLLKIKINIKNAAAILTNCAEKAKLNA